MKMNSLFIGIVSIHHIKDRYLHLEWESIFNLQDCNHLSGIWLIHFLKTFKWPECSHSYFNSC